MADPHAAIDRLVQGARVVICVGPGGVGKTSASAAIALQAAHAGRRVAVLTIDPARRLANALGLPEIGNEERVISPLAFDSAKLPVPKGKLTAMMLDIKRTWDETVLRHHPDPERREQLLNNRFYQTLSTALAGSQEYMAMEKLHELSVRRGDPLDLIVLDTPPSANAVDFLEAPAKIIDALDNDATRWLLEPYTARGRVTAKIFDAGSSMVIRTIGRFTGVEVLQELAELLSCFQGMFEGFRQRARSVRATLLDERTVFLVVSAPRPGPIAEAAAFRDRLVSDGLRVGGLVLNRAQVDPFASGKPSTLEELRDAVDRAGGTADLAQRLHGAAEQARMAASAEREASAALSLAGAIPVVLVPELDRDVHDLSGLDQLRRGIFETS